MQATGSAHGMQIISEGVRQTIEAGERLGRLLSAGDLVVLYGPFGAGKTHLTKGIASGLGVAEQDVTSPSFVLINEYRAAGVNGGFPIFHVDLYRLESEADFESIGLQECWEGHGLCLIEWAERAEQLFPDERLEVRLDYLDEERRQIMIVPHGERYSRLVEKLNIEESGARG